MILILAMLLDATLGEPDWLWSRLRHPAVMMGQLIGWTDDTFNLGDGRRLKGLYAISALVLCALFLGWFIASLPLGWLWQVLLGAILIAQRSLVNHVRDVGDALRIGLPEGRQAVAKIVGRDVNALDENGVARSAIESAAENLSDGIVAPIFWFAALGLPGILAYKMINTADSMIGYRTTRHEDFGWAAANLDDIVNWIPARLTALLILLVYGRPELFGMIMRDAKKHRSPNAGWPEAATAGVLDIALSGPRSYEGVMRDEAFVNETGKHDLMPSDIDRTCGLLWRTWGLLLACVISWEFFL
jgi:adenosylcobinamide-phosphate synthase